MKFIAQHPLSSQRPLNAYWRYVRWQIESRLRDEVVFNWIDGSKLVARNGMTGATGNIYCGLHEFADMAFLLHLLRPGDVFVDAGANIGSYMTLASAVCGARTIAIEPDPEAVGAIKKNIAINKIGDLVTVAECAVGATKGTAQFTIGHDTTNRVASMGDGPTREVQVLALDDIIGMAQPTLMKLDVEGYEPQVFAGAQRTLEKPSLSAIITETEDVHIRDLLARHGFVRALYAPLTRALMLVDGEERSAGSNNSLFVRPHQMGDRLKTAVRRSAAGIAI